MPKIINEDDFQVWKHEKFGELKCIVVNDTIWFNGKDIALALGYTKTISATLSQRVDSKYKTTLTIRKGGSNYTTNITVINESGLYQFIMRSEMPNAKEFQKWVIEVVLPAIHKYGAYFSPEMIDKIEHGDQKEAMTKVIEANKVLAKQAKDAKELQEYFQASSDCCSVRTLAGMLKQRGYTIGEKRMFDWLRANNYLSNQPSSYNVPLSWAIEKGLFQIDVKRMIHYTTKNPKKAGHVPMITPTGQIQIIEAYIGSYDAMHGPNALKPSDITSDGFLKLKVIKNGRFEKFRKIYRKNHPEMKVHNR